MHTVQRRIAGGILSAMLFAVPALAAAETVRITPSLIDGANTVEQALITHKSHASTKVEGQGARIVIGYQSSEDLEVYMVPLAADNTYVPTDFLRFTLPMATDGSVSVDLTVSPGWSSGNQKWILHLLSADDKAGAGFSDIHFDDTSIMTAASAAIRHLFTQEQYTPSTYHGLHGYRMLGFSVTVVLGILMTVIAILGMFASGKNKRREVFVGALIAGSLLYQARFAVDLLRFSAQHLREYANAQYDEAGSVHAVAAFIRSQSDGAKDPLKIYVCRDGTNFKEKLLRYFTYPAHVSAEAASASGADIVVVMDKFKGAYQTTPSKDGTGMQLGCGDVNSPARKLSSYPDGTEVYRLLPSPVPPTKS